MSDRTDDPMDWMEDEMRFAAEEAEETEARDREEEARLDTAFYLSRCARAGCWAEGTEKLGDEHVCPAHLQQAFDERYERERERQNG